MSLLARHHPGYFILFTEHEPQIVLNEIDSLVKQSLAQLQPRYTCILCHNTFTDQLEAISHSYTHPRMQTRQKQRVCITNIIRDTNFYLYSCPRCPATFPSKTNLHAHMHLHVDKKIYKCRFCPYTGIQHCQLVEHVLRTHASRSNIHCQECPIGLSPFFTHTQDYLVHLSHTHHNSLATHLTLLFSDDENIPTIPEVNTKGVS